MEIAVNVMPDCDPACVIEVLRRVAVAHPRVSEHPKPNAYFLKMSPAAFEFEVRAWTNFYDEWFQIRSDLTVSLHEALRKEGVALAPTPATPVVVK
jgi:small-conductance mechanosensitive channel